MRGNRCGENLEKKSKLRIRLNLPSTCTNFRNDCSRGERSISRVFYRPEPPQAHKRLDVQEPGLRPGRGPGAEFAGRAACTPKKNIRAESVLFAFINVHPTPIVCCAAMYLGCPPPDGECRALRSVGVMVAAMDLSRLFQRPKYRFHQPFHQLRASHLFFGFTAACLPIHPHPPNPAHVPFTYHASRIDRPGG